MYSFLLPFYCFGGYLLTYINDFPMLIGYTLFALKNNKRR